MLGSNKKGMGLKTILKSITTAGTPEAISSLHKFCKFVEVMPAKTNTSPYVAFGEESVVTLSTEAGELVAKGNSYKFTGVYLDEIFADVGTDADEVAITYEESRVVAQ